jgi:hypothetical protein
MISSNYVATNVHITVNCALLVSSQLISTQRAKGVVAVLDRELFHALEFRYRRTDDASSLMRPSSEKDKLVCG